MVMLGGYSVVVVFNLVPGDGGGLNMPAAYSKLKTHKKLTSFHSSNVHTNFSSKVFGTKKRGIARS